jgi:hypothetical protein
MSAAIARRKSGNVCERKKKKKKECARRDHLGRFAAEQSRVEQSIGKERKRAIAVCAYVGGGWQRAPYANENFPFQLVCMRDGPEYVCVRDAPRLMRIRSGEWEKKERRDAFGRALASSSFQPP